MDRSAGSAFSVPRMAGRLELRQVRQNVLVGSSCHGALASTKKTTGVRLLISHVQGPFLECDMREVEERKLTKLILKGQGASSPDIGCHLEHRHGCDGRVEVEACARQPNSRRSRLSSFAMMALSLHGTSWFRSRLRFGGST